MLKEISANLKKKYNQSQVFQKEYDDIMQFYLHKFKKYVLDSDSTLIDELGLVFNRQFLQGVLIVEEFAKNFPETAIVQKQTSFVEIMNELPSEFYKAYAEKETDMYYVDTSHALAMDLLSTKGPMVFDALEVVYQELTNLGITYAVIDKYSELIIEDEAYDLVKVVQPIRLNPQLYLLPILNPVVEAEPQYQYEIFSYNGKKDGMWQGRVYATLYPEGNGKLDILLQDSIHDVDQQHLIIKLAEMMKCTNGVAINNFIVNRVQNFTF